MRRLLAVLLALMAASLSLETAARADCAATVDCICPSNAPIAVLTVRVEASDAQGVHARVEAIAPVGVSVPVKVGDMVITSGYSPAGPVEIGETLLASMGSSGSSSVELGPRVSANGTVTCAFEPSFVLSVGDAEAAMLRPDCASQLQARGLRDLPCEDEDASACALVAGSPGRRPAGAPLSVTLAIAAALALRRRQRV